MPDVIFQQPRPGVPQHPLRRNVPDAVLGGVCAGVACRLGLSVRPVRVAFAVASLFAGLGAFSYVVLWVLVPRDGEPGSIARTIERQRRSVTTVLWSLVVVLGALAAITILQLGHYGLYSLALLLSIVGVVAVVAGASSAERQHLEGILQSAPVVGGLAARGWRAIVWRVIPALILVVIGLRVLGRQGPVVRTFVPLMLGAAVVVAGVALVLAPWWLENLRDISRERRGRIRAEERASLVAHVHDSVLQTLTLIERSAGDRDEVMRLARAQERELRHWLFDPEVLSSTQRSSGSLVERLRVLQSEIERDYRVRVELVNVGDLDTDDRLTSLVGAAREAAINAAKWSGAETLSVFSEVEDDQVSVFVRDTGCGFDPAAVATDRHGLRLSITERLADVGGHASIRSHVGEGTEVELVLSRVVAPS